MGHQGEHDIVYHFAIYPPLDYIMCIGTLAPYVNMHPLVM